VSLLLAVVVCPILNISNASLNTTNTNFSTTVLVTCNSGYAIDPLNPTNNTALTSCTRNGNWSTSIVCQRIFVGGLEKHFCIHCDICAAIVNCQDYFFLRNTYVYESKKRQNILCFSTFFCCFVQYLINFFDKIRDSDNILIL
jgi:hypothetical protein